MREEIKVRQKSGLTFDHHSSLINGPLVKWSKTSAFHVGNDGSNPSRVTIVCLYFHSFLFLTLCYRRDGLHTYPRSLSWYKQAPYKRQTGGSNPLLGTTNLLLFIYLFLYLFFAVSTLDPKWRVICGSRIMVVQQPSKLLARVRFPLTAPKGAEFGGRPVT